MNCLRLVVDIFVSVEYSHISVDCEFERLESDCSHAFEFFLVCLKLESNCLSSVDVFCRKCRLRGDIFPIEVFYDLICGLIHETALDRIGLTLDEVLELYGVFDRDLASSMGELGLRSRILRDRSHDRRDFLLIRRKACVGRIARTNNISRHSILTALDHISDIDIGAAAEVWVVLESLRRSFLSDDYRTKRKRLFPGSVLIEFASAAVFRIIEISPVFSILLISSQQPCLIRFLSCELCFGLIVNALIEIYLEDCAGEAVGLFGIQRVSDTLSDLDPHRIRLGCLGECGCQFIRGACGSCLRFDSTAADLITGGSIDFLYPVFAKRKRR